MILPLCVYWSFDDVPEVSKALFVVVIVFIFFFFVSKTK